MCTYNWAITTILSYCFLWYACPLSGIEWYGMPPSHRKIHHPYLHWLMGFQLRQWVMVSTRSLTWLPPIQQPMMVLWSHHCSRCLVLALAITSFPVLMLDMALQARPLFKHPMAILKCLSLQVSKEVLSWCQKSNQTAHQQTVHTCSIIVTISKRLLCF